MAFSLVVLLKLLSHITKHEVQCLLCVAVTIALGNPGSGKSTILNSLAGEAFFKSGLSIGKGLTNKLDQGTNFSGVFLDTPGLADMSMRKTAAKAIYDGFRQGGDYKIIFFVTETNGRVHMQDVTTMQLILEAVPYIGMNYGIVVNMVSKGILKKLDEKSCDFLEILFVGIPEEIRCPSNR